MTEPTRDNEILRYYEAEMRYLREAGKEFAQAVSDSTADAATWAFTTWIKTMNVDLTGRASLNTDATGQSLSTVVRFYQLKDAKGFEKLSYAQLQSDDLNLLKDDVLATKDVVLRPGASASIAQPMNADAQVVGVVAFFRDPAQGKDWKLAIQKKQWKKTDPVKIEVNDNALELVGADTQSVRHHEPLQGRRQAQSRHLQQPHSKPRGERA